MSSSSSPPASRFVGALLRVAWQEARRRAMHDLALAGFGDLQEAHFMVLSHPGPQGMRPSALAQRLGMSKQATNHLLGALERLGYLERRTDPDGVRRIHLTARGESLIPTVRASMRALEEDWASRLGEERFAQFLETLRDIAAMVSEQPGE